MHPIDLHFALHAADNMVGLPGYKEFTIEWVSDTAKYNNVNTRGYRNIEDLSPT